MAVNTSALTGNRVNTSALVKEPVGDVISQTKFSPVRAFRDLLRPSGIAERIGGKVSEFLRIPTRPEIVSEIEEERQQTLLPEEAARLAKEKEFEEFGGIRIGGKLVDLFGIGFLKKQSAVKVKQLITFLTKTKKVEDAVTELKKLGATDTDALKIANQTVDLTDFKAVREVLQPKVSLKITALKKAPTKDITPELQPLAKEVPKFDLTPDKIRRGEELARAEKRKTITDPEELIKFIEKEGSGNVGVFLKVEEKKTLSNFLKSVTNKENVELRGAIIGLERKAVNEGNDLILGKVNENFIVVAEKGFGAGKVRIHATSLAISKQKVLGKISTNEFLLGEPPTPPKAPQLPQQPRIEKKIEIQKDSEIFSLEERVPQKVFTEQGRILIDDKGTRVFPKEIKETPTPLDSPVFQTEVRAVVGKLVDRQVKRGKQALESVGKQRGNTERIISDLKRRGVSPTEIDNIILENGERLVDTVKVKREINGVLSAIITKKDLAKIEQAVKGLNLAQKWIPTKTTVQKIQSAGRTSRLAILNYYELPQLFFDRTGLREPFYDPIRQARRNASQMKTDIFNRFVDAGLMKRQGWFTADRFTISKKESEDVGRYLLTRQDKVKGVNERELSDLTPKAKKWVKMFDDVIEESEPRFRKVAELNGKNPGVVENYAPLMTNDDFKLAQEMGDLDFIFRKHPAFFSLKQRAEEVPFAMYELDYRKVAIRWIDQIANFNHLGEVGVQVKYLANSQEFKDIAGDRIFNTVNKWLQDTFNPQVLSDAERLLRVGRQAQSIASLGLNIGSVVKQTLSIVPLTIIEKAPPKLKSKFARDFGINVRDLPSITERKGNASIMDMQEGFRKATVGALTRADQKVAQVELNALLDKNYRQLLKDGASKDLSPEQQALVLKQAQDTLDMWMGGMTPEQLPRAFRTELGKIVNMFIMPLTSQLNGFIFSVAKAKGLAKPEKIAEVLAGAVIIAYLEQVITNMSVNWSNAREMVNDTLASLAGNIPIISQIVFALRTDQPVSPSPLASAVGRLAQQSSKAFKDQADAIDVTFAALELFPGIPKQIRRTVEGVEIAIEGGIRDKNGKLLAPVRGTDEQVRAFIRGKYGTIATQDWIRNIGVKTEQREWFVPEVEFLQNGDYTRKAQLFRTFDKETQEELRVELTEGQLKKLDKALNTTGGIPSPREAFRSSIQAGDVSNDAREVFRSSI